MKKVLCSIVALFAICSFVACSNGDYVANPSSIAGNSANPLNPLDSAGFNWGGTDPFSAKINGVPYQGDSAGTYYGYNGGLDDIVTTNGTQGFALSFKAVYTGGIYNMGAKQYNNYGVWSDSITSGTAQYFSYNGNVGQVQILENDSIRFKGKFYFQGVAADGKIVNVTDGYFNIRKH